MQKTIKTVFLTALASLALQAHVHADAVSSWALPEYTKAANAGIVTYNVISKNLKESITREEFCELSVALLQKLTGVKAQSGGENPFTDSDNPYVSIAYQNGLVSGTSSDKFEPQRFVTRQEMAKMIENALSASQVSYEKYDANSKLPLFNDITLISDWAVPAVSVVTRYSIMSGSDGNFNPGGNATREQAIISLYRAFENFADKNVKTYPIKCTSLSNGFEITDSEARVSCTPISKAKKYIVLIKDENGNVVKDISIEAPSAFKINKSTLPYGDNYSLTMGAIISDGSEVFTAPVNFSFKEPKNAENTAVTPDANTDEPTKNELTEAPIKTEENTEELPKEEITEETPVEEKSETTTETEKEIKKEPEKEAQDEPDMTIGFEDEVTSDKAKALISEAEKYLGIPYVYGGTTPDGFDCSGYVKYVFEKFSITLQRVSRDQYKYCGTEVARKDLQPGDLVFFGSNGVVGHVGIYTGKGQMIHSPSTGKSICYTSIESNYYKSHYIGAKRIF